MEHPRAEEFLTNARARLQLAHALHEERTSQKLTMAELAKRAGTTPAVISRIEHAQVSAGIDIIYRLFKALNKKEIHLVI